MKNRKNHRKQSDYCHQSGKKRFRDPREATARLQSLLNQARLLDEQGKDHTIHVVRKYRCNACRGWHLTSWENYGAPQDEAPPAPAVPASRDPLMISLAASLKRTRTAKKGTLRAQEMCDRRAAGETLDQIGEAYGVTRERVRQIIKAAGGPTRSDVKDLKVKRQAMQDAEDATRLRKLMHQYPGRTRAELAELSGISFNRISELLGEDTRFLVTPQRAREHFSDEDIFRAMRAAAARFDRPLSHARYATVAAEVGGPSVPRIIQRFGTWLKACEAAGVRPGGKGRGNYVRRWTKTEILNWVAVYLQSDGCDGTYAGYDRWARTTAGAPSSATMRNALGKWADVKRAALLLLDDENGRAA